MSYLFQLVTQDRVYLTGVSLATRLLHHLADEESEHLFLAGAKLLDLFGIGRDDLVDQGLDCAAIGNLPEAARLDDIIGAALALPHRVEYLLGDLAGNGVVGNARHQLCQHRRRDR